MINIKQLICINLDSRKDRWEQVNKDIQELQSVFQFDFHRKKPIEHPIPRVSLRMTVQDIIRDAKNQHLEYVAICEDDLYVIDTDKVKTCLQNPPDDWDLLSGGVYYFRPYQDGHTEHWKKLNDYCSMHFVIIKNTLYDKILNMNKNDTGDIDRIIGQWIKKYNLNVYVMHPMPCKQRSGYSNLRKMNVNYNNYRLPWIKKVDN